MMRLGCIIIWNRYYDPELGRYITADPIWLEGGVNLYLYTGSDPINWSDPTGLIVHYQGTPEDIALIQSWMDKLKECAKCDEELKKRLDEVLNGPYNFYIGFQEGFGAGGFSPRRSPSVRLDPVLRKPNQTSFFYNVRRSLSEWIFGGGDPRTGGNFRGPDVLAHELLGHGYDWSQGDRNDNQRKAIDLANKIRACLGNKQPQRAY